MNSHPPKIACIGSGVIGSGWAARFLLNGFDVAVYDPSPDAKATTEHILDNARRALAALTTVRLPQEGQLSFSASLADAVAGAALIQESVPERLDLKLAVLAEIEAACGNEALIASSTSGFLPSTLQAGLRHPERLLIAHPYNPVYLLPLVELVPGEKTTGSAIESASAYYRQTGMEPVVLEKEIDAFVGTAFWKRCGARHCGLCVTVSLQSSRLTISFAILLVFAGLRWGCSRPIALRVVPQVCGISSPSSGLRCNGLGRN